jgi:hypothetical protein
VELELVFLGFHLLDFCGGAIPYGAPNYLIYRKLVAGGKLAGSYPR